MYAGLQTVRTSQTRMYAHAPRLAAGGLCAAGYAPRCVFCSWSMAQTSPANARERGQAGGAKAGEARKRKLRQDGGRVGRADATAQNGSPQRAVRRGARICLCLRMSTSLHTHTRRRKRTAAAAHLILPETLFLLVARLPARLLLLARFLRHLRVDLAPHLLRHLPRQRCELVRAVSEPHRIPTARWIRATRSPGGPPGALLATAEMHGGRTRAAGSRARRCGDAERGGPARRGHGRACAMPARQREREHRRHHRRACPRHARSSSAARHSNS